MRALVTGGGGFLGGAIVERLLAGGYEVRSFSRGQYPHLNGAGVEHIQGDLCDWAAVSRAAQGCDVVFHAAARPGIWGDFRDFYRINVLGTFHVVDSCRVHRIPKLIFTSSPSVVFAGRDLAGVNESAKYPVRYKSHYPLTKAIAEQLVLQANTSTLATVALRPHLIWGPRDNHLVPRILARARSGKLWRIGSRECLIDTIYIDNAAEAHISAADHLEPGSVAAGRAYFISQGEPIGIWDMINRILTAAQIAPVTRTIPVWLAYSAGWIFESLYRTLGWLSEPGMTRFLVEELSTSHWFDISAARRDFNFCPKVSIAEGLDRLRDYFNANGDI